MVRYDLLIFRTPLLLLCYLFSAVWMHHIVSTVALLRLYPWRARVDGCQMEPRVQSANLRLAGFEIFTIQDVYYIKYRWKPGS